MATLEKITIYPVKSCAGIDLEQCRVAEYGLELDRHWMITDLSGRFLSQRDYPSLARVVTKQDGDIITLNGPGMEPLMLSRSDESYHAATVVTVWADSLHAYIVSDDANQWFSDYLGIRARLVRYDETMKRKLDQRWAGGLNATTQFADGFSFLVTVQASLDDLNSRLRLKGVSPLPMSRFRPNLVLSGLDAYSEDKIEMVFIGSAPHQVQLKFVKKCTRCSIPALDQITGLRDSEWPDEPLATLADYRFDPEAKGLTFGQNAILIKGEAETLLQGQAVECHFA